MTAPGKAPHGGIEERSFDGVVESDARRAKSRALPGLRGGMIHFEDTQSRGSELIFGVAAAGGDRDREWIDEDPRLIENQTLRWPDGDTLGGPAGRCVLDG